MLLEALYEYTLYIWCGVHVFHAQEMDDLNGYFTYLECRMELEWMFESIIPVSVSISDQAMSVSDEVVYKGS